MFIDSIPSPDQAIYERKRNDIQCHEPRLPPRKSIKLPARDRPQYGSWKKLIGMGWHIDHDMYEPSKHLPNGALEDQPHQPEHKRKNDQAVTYIVECFGQLSNKLPVTAKRLGIARIKSSSRRPHPNKCRSERKKIREDAPQSSLPNRNPCFGFQIDTMCSGSSPQPMREDVHIYSVCPSLVRCKSKNDECNNAKPNPNHL
ncbi:MAG: hypothetical protein UX90_C0002G0185 [Candidatus Wolfebacteria bacterium GW2011_GWD2_47_17]|nr:MAG: hypothetical protein UX90_C0002G0185 [Candidatus Wolfebacteria bacterium GW2011_GWD2_47_17]